VAIFLGIDGGGSKTACAVGDESSVLATSVAAGSNIVRVGEERAREALHTAIRQACGSAGIAASEIRGACVGMAGAARPEINGIVERIVAELLPGKIEVVGDMEIALEAAFGAGPGIVVIAGTGSIAYGRNAEGETARAGGWGFAVSDEGSGHWIGRRAVSVALRAMDDEGGSGLYDAIRKEWGTSTLEEFVRTANVTPVPDFAALFPAIVAEAESDSLAADVLHSAGAELAALGLIIVRKLFPDLIAQVAMSGGVFRHSGIVRDNFCSRLRAEARGVDIGREVADPLQGALQRARRMPL